MWAPRRAATVGAHRASSMRVITRFAPRACNSETVRRRSHASQEVASVHGVEDIRARELVGEGSQLGRERRLQVLQQQAVGGGDRGRHPVRRGHPAHEGAADRRDLFEERGAVGDGALDPRGQRELGRDAGHVGPLAPQLQRGHVVVEVVHVGEVVEHEAQRHAGPLGHGPRRRVPGRLRAGAP